MYMKPRKFHLRVMSRFLPVLHGIGIREPLDDLGDSGPLLSDSDVNAEQLLLLVSCIVESLLVDDGVDSDGGFAGLPVTDDQLTLATTDGHQGIDGLDTGLEEHGSLELSFEPRSQLFVLPAWAP